MRDGHAVLTVTNTGPRVPASELERLFQPFQRLNGTRTNRRRLRTWSLDRPRDRYRTPRPNHGTATTRRRPLDRGQLPRHPTSHANTHLPTSRTLSKRTIPTASRTPRWRASGASPDLAARGRPRVPPIAQPDALRASRHRRTTPATLPPGSRTRLAIQCAGCSASGRASPYHATRPSCRRNITPAISRSRSQSRRRSAATASVSRPAASSARPSTESIEAQARAKIIPRATKPAAHIADPMAVNSMNGIRGTSCRSSRPPPPRAPGDQPRRGESWLSDLRRAPGAVVILASAAAAEGLQSLMCAFKAAPASVALIGTSAGLSVIDPAPRQGVTLWLVLAPSPTSPPRASIRSGWRPDLISQTESEPRSEKADAHWTRAAPKPHSKGAALPSTNADSGTKSRDKISRSRNYLKQESPGFPGLSCIAGAGFEPATFG